MTKKGCCCKEENPNVKHYIAVRCFEYETQFYAEPKIHKVYDSWPNTGRIFGLGDEPDFPYKVTGLASGNSSLLIAKDPSRKIKFMLKGAGGGAPFDSFGGNAAYIDFNVISSSEGKLNSMSLFVGAGGTGGPHFDFRNTTPLYGGGPGFGFAGWGGGAAAYGDSSQSLEAGGQYVVGAGGGAGSDLDSDTRYGGHGGVINGEAGDGPFGGLGATNTAPGLGGGAGGFGGGFRIGGLGFRFSPPPSFPVNVVGGGGGSGVFGGGGGGSNSSGGGGASTIADIFSGKPIDNGFNGTFVGPGSRCSPFFSKTTDPGLGANRKGRYIENSDLENISLYRGANAQAAEYHRTRWCPCFENQTSNIDNSTGYFTNGLNYICLTEFQYNFIITQALTLPDYNNIYNAGAGYVKTSFLLGGQRYVLLPWEEDVYGDPTTNHYYCSLGCENAYLSTQIPTDVKWYISTQDNFTNYSDSREFFKTLYTSSGMDLSSVTSCCDIFIGERICFPENSSNCSNSVDQNGDYYGCFCENVQLPPKYKSICSTQVSTKSPFIAVDPNSQFYYLCIPAFGWRRFGVDSVNTLYNYFDGNDEDNKINLGSNLQYYSNASSLEIEDLRQELCEQQQSGPAGACNQNPDDDCVCRVIISRPYTEKDPEGINQPITFKHSGGKVCSRDLYGSGGQSCEGCPEEKAAEISLNENTFTFQQCTQPFICDIRGCYAIDPNIPGCGPSQGCGSCTDPCTGNSLTLIQLFSFFKKIYNSFENNLYRAGNFLLNSKTSTVTKIQGSTLNPCDVLPSYCYGAGTFLGYKSKIERNGCPDSNWVESQTCRDCGCIKEQTQEAIKCGSTDMVKEHLSWETWMCVGISESSEDDYYESTAFEIYLNPCLFSGLNSAEALAKASQLIKLEQQSIDANICSEDITIGGYRLTICLLCIDIASGSAYDITQYINGCIGGFAFANALDDSGWFGKRRMNCNVCDEYKLRDGDELMQPTFEFAAGNSIKAVFKFKSKRYQACVAVDSKPVCDTTNGNGPADCYTFGLSDSTGNIFVQYKSTNSVSYPEWAGGTKWQFTTVNGNEQNPNFEVCAPDKEQIGPQSCILIKRSNCTFDKPEGIIYSGQCCTVMTNCGDNPVECTSITEIEEYCRLCENQQCDSGVCTTDGLNRCCTDPSGCPSSNDCSEFQITGCVIQAEGIPGPACLTQVGSLEIFA